MHDTAIASYGTWRSPISAEMIAQGSTTILNLLLDGTSTYWCESRPANKGRYTIVCRDVDGKLQDMTPPDFNVRTFVHEYGGGAFTVDRGIIYASNALDSALYIIKHDQAPRRLTKGQTFDKSAGKLQWQGVRFADMRVTKHGLIAIGEEHTPGQPVQNFLALIDLTTGTHQQLAAGHDFYASPAISADGKKIAWLCWNHPNMPWTHTELWTAEMDSHGKLHHAQRIAGDTPESILQPQWSEDGTLYFITDRDQGWWNLHGYYKGKIKNICPMDAEMGEPLWIFDKSSYALCGDKIFFCCNHQGRWRLAVLDRRTRTWQPLPQAGVAIQHLRGGKGFVQFLEGYDGKDEAIIQIEDAPGYPARTLYAKPALVDEGYLSLPQHIAFASCGRTAYAYYYPPKNKDFTAPIGELPPLVVMIHGGPTAQARCSLQLKQQYWTSRGFAVLDVNYGGSTGYGRDYRNLLNHNWGVVDVQDCIHGALFLVKQGLVDANKLVIRGGSAGGYTTLAALTCTDIFKAGADYFGVADVTALAKETHKFESSYMHELIGKYPEEEALWQARSPIHAVAKIKSPLIIFQGEDDPIVPKNQSIMIFEALKQAGIRTEMHIYPGEEHGFKHPAHIIHSLNREAEFYLEVFGLLKPKTVI